MAALNLVAEDSGAYFPVYDSTGAPKDLTGYTVRAQVRAYPDADDVLYEWSTAAGTAVVEPGKITLTWTRADILATEFDGGVVDILLTDSADVTTLVPVGSVSVNRGVTR